MDETPLKSDPDQDQTSPKSDDQKECLTIDDIVDRIVPNINIRLILLFLVMTWTTWNTASSTYIRK